MSKIENKHCLKEPNQGRKVSIDKTAQMPKPQDKQANSYINKVKKRKQEQ